MSRVAPSRARRHWLSGMLLERAGVRTQMLKPSLVGVPVSSGLTPLGCLRQGMSALGCVENQSVRYAFRSADGNPSELPVPARHVANLDVDMMFCAGPAAVDAVEHASSRVKIVALDLETDPVQSGLVRSAPYPLINVTNVFLDEPALMTQWIKLLRQADLRARRLNLFWEASSGSWQLADVKFAASVHGFEADTIIVCNERNFERGLIDGMETRSKAMLLLSLPLVRARSAQVAAFTQNHHLLAMSAFNEFTRACMLMSYGPEVPDCSVSPTIFVDQILKGLRAGDLPLVMPYQVALVVNAAAATALQLKMPPPLRSASQEVIH